MNLVCTPYQCRTCENVSWKQEDCHGKPMELLCYCGSGQFAVDCHGLEQQPQQNNHTHA